MFGHLDIRRCLRALVGCSVLCRLHEFRGYELVVHLQAPVRSPEYAELSRTCLEGASRVLVAGNHSLLGHD